MISKTATINLQQQRIAQDRIFLNWNKWYQNHLESLQAGIFILNTVTNRISSDKPIIPRKHVGVDRQGAVISSNMFGAPTSRSPAPS